MNKKWTIAGILIAIAGFFIHPESCISATDIIGKIIPNSPQDVVAHISMFTGATLAVIGDGLLTKKDATNGTGKS